MADLTKHRKKLSHAELQQKIDEIKSFNEDYDHDAEILNLDDDQLSELPYEAQHAHLADISEIDDILTESSPSDFIYITKESNEYLVDYMVDQLGLVQDFTNQLVPIDIFESNNVPIKDLMFKVDILDLNDELIHSVVCIRCIYKNNKLYIVINNKNNATTVLTTKLYTDDQVYIDPSIFYIKNLGYYVVSGIEDRHAIKAVPFHISQYFIAIWYTIQVMLLNPAIKEHVFINDRKEKFRGNSKEMLGLTLSKKRKAKYVKYKKLNYEKLNSETFRKQHTLCWYVMGHYRYYQNGKKTWIDGYWKGPLREIQRNLDEGRERIVTQ